MRNVFGWEPNWFTRADLATPDRTILIGTLAALFVLNGFIGPIVEELYFRGWRAWRAWCAMARPRRGST
jgi:membrane protease YdiL (CAAX protease family)